MKSMKLTTTNEPIPASILAIAVDINSRIGDQNITVTIHDEKTGREYRIEPHGRREKDETLHRERMEARAVQR